jgi:uncharacterized protein (TIGR02001 family)
MDAQVVSSPKWVATVAALVRVRVDRSWLVPVALAGLVMLPCVGRAQGTWSGSLGASSDYVYRGISQTFGAALQIGGSYQSPLGWFAGAWGSNVDPYPGGASYEEVDAYAGVIRPVGADFTVKGTYTHYGYLEDPRRARHDYDEVALSVAYLDLIAATVAYQPNYTSFSQLGYTSRGPAESYELTGQWPLKYGFAVTGGAGYYNLHHLFGVGYWAGDLGVAYVYPLARGRLTLNVTHFFADATAAALYENASADHKWVFSATWRF